MACSKCGEVNIQVDIYQESVDTFLFTGGSLDHPKAGGSTAKPYVVPCDEVECLECGKVNPVLNYKEELSEVTNVRMLVESEDILDYKTSVISALENLLDTLYYTEYESSEAVESVVNDFCDANTNLGFKS